MKYNVELGANIKFTDEDGTHTFTEGDNVICCLGDEKRYVGKITCIGNYQENEDSEPEQAICIDTSKSKTSYSSEIVKTADILMETAKECSAMAVKAFAELIDVFKEAVASGETDIPTFSEILDLVTENWSKLVDDDKEKVTKILAGVKDTAAK